MVALQMKDMMPSTLFFAFTTRIDCEQDPTPATYQTLLSVPPMPPLIYGSQCSL